jgi:hypothetical protein
MAGPGESYRSHTVANTLSHVFHFRVIVPTDAIPTTGIELYVQDDDGEGDQETQENIGALRLSRVQLASALAGNGLLRLNDKEGGLDAIEIAVSAAEGPRSFTQVLDVAAIAAVVEVSMRVVRGLTSRLVWRRSSKSHLRGCPLASGGS